jgi:hypothetical protein
LLAGGATDDGLEEVDDDVVEVGGDNTDEAGLDAGL